MSMKKEDLVKTYIVNDNGPLRDAYLSACKEYIGVSSLYRCAFPNDEHLYFNPSYNHLQSGCCDIDNYKQLHLADLIDLENSKVYTADEVVIRKYAELCGFKGRILFDAEGVHIGVAFVPKAIMPNDLFAFSKLARLHTEGKTESGIAVSEIATKQINALYAEKFGDGSNEKQTNETANTVEHKWESGDECVWRGNAAIVIGYHPSHPAIIIDSDEFGLTSVSLTDLRKPETESERLERERRDLINDTCEELFGDLPEQLRPDVVGTIEAMLDAGYRKESK